MSNSSITNMITSKEILVKTSISRATLNNYIKFGILPKPVVRSAGADLTGVNLTGVNLKGTKHIGYFPKDVLDDIATVKRLKREGRSMKEIVSEFTERQSVGEMYPHERTEETGSNQKLLSAKAKIINELLEQRTPSLVSLCVLVADLQNLVKISAELLPGEYFELINQLWATVTSSVDKYDGIYGKHTGDGMLYYFIKKPESNYIINSINCAIELKEQMKEFSDEWKVRKGWLNDLVLNIGISEGQEFLGTIRSSSNIELMTLGDSINYAARLSDFARSGSIWTTKNLISKLDQEEITKIRFGICRKKDGREIFLQNSFSRIIDLIDIDDPNYRKHIDVAMLPVTEIFGTTG